MFWLHVVMCTIFMLDACRGQGQGARSLDLEYRQLWVHVGTGNWRGSSARIMCSLTAEPSLLHQICLSLLTNNFTSLTKWLMLYTSKYVYWQSVDACLCVSVVWMGPTRGWESRRTFWCIICHSPCTVVKWPGSCRGMCCVYHPSTRVRCVSPHLAFCIWIKLGSLCLHSRYFAHWVSPSLNCQILLEVILSGQVFYNYDVCCLHIFF